MVTRQKTIPSEICKYWYKKTYRSIKEKRLPEKSEERKDFSVTIAGYVALVGGKHSHKAKRVFKALKILFLDRDRTSTWYRTAAELPADSTKLVNLAELIHGYESLALSGKVVTLDAGRINLENVVYYALKVCDQWEAFLEAAGESWMNYPAQIFSEQFLREAARSHRGAFGDFSEEDHSDGLDNIEVIR